MFEIEKIKKSFKTSNGITLIALVITIIVLLILAGISISMLSGDNGILQKATDAKTKTDIEQIKERIKLAYHAALTGGQGSYTKESLENELENEFGDDFEEVDDSDNTNWVLKAKGQSVTIPAGKKEDRTGINVGDYVNFRVDKDKDNSGNEVAKVYLATNLGFEYTGSSSNSDLTQQDLKWRVLKVNEDGSIKLVANMALNNTISFKGATGYNNAVWILHDVCEKLYSGTINGKTIKARSISLEDYEDESYYYTGENGTLVTGKWKTEKENYITDLVNTYKTLNDVSVAVDKSNKTVTYISEKSYYPNIYAKQNGSGINSQITKTDGIRNNDKDELDKTTGENAKKKANNLTVTQTAYELEFTEENYGDAAKVLKDTSGGSHFIATRCEEPRSDYGGTTSCAFGIFYGGWNLSHYYSICYYSSGNESRNRIYGRFLHKTSSHYKF